MIFKETSNVYFGRCSGTTLQLKAIVLVTSTDNALNNAFACVKRASSIYCCNDSRI